MDWNSIQQLIRIIMQIAAGYLISMGVMTEEIATAMTGGVVSLGMVVWWVFWERHRLAEEDA
jgi:hypothetical protein